MSLSPTSSRAPRVNLRRPAHHTRLGALLLTVSVISYFLSSAISPGWIWVAWMLINLTAWGWESVTSTINRDNLQPAETPAFYRRRYIRRSIFIGAIIANVIILGLLSFSDNEAFAGLTCLMLVIYNLLVVGWVEYEFIRWYRDTLGLQLYIWISASLIIGAVTSWTIWKLSNDPYLGIGAGIVSGAMGVVVYVMQRLGVEDRVLADVIRRLIIQILGISKTRGQWDTIVEQIRDRLRYDQVFILEPDMDHSQLVIVAEAGNHPSVLGSTLAIQDGITGRAFEREESEPWNDVSQCPYYHRLMNGKTDETQAEIAVPIRYQGFTYGILDVQDKHKNVFRWDDIHTLEVIARILGVAISAQRTDMLISEASSLWDELSSQQYGEESIFREFARFAQGKLGADIIAYYPLSPTGSPVAAPYHYGNLLFPDQLKAPSRESNTPIVRLIHDWQPRFIDSVSNDPVFRQWSQENPNSFVTREQIQSLCFIPIGTNKERLGAMFLNYRNPRRFDNLFQFIMLSLSQTFAILISRELYINILFEGFGRPELAVHNLFGRYGLKVGVQDEGKKIFQRACAGRLHISYADCGMGNLLERVDGFLGAVSLAQSSIPPYFRRESLIKELEEFTSSLPMSKIGRRPDTHMSLDPKIEREGPWVKLALYRLITESMNNAVFHGQATEITVRVMRDEYSIVVEITNDGNPLPVDAQARRSRRGIYSLLADLETKFGAQTHIKRGLQDMGTIVNVTLPAIPISQES